MIGLDTNVLARYFVKDDPVQFEQAKRFIATRCTIDEPGFVDRVALCELVWVLRGHGYQRADIMQMIEQLLASQELNLEDHAVVRLALDTYRGSGVDFADALIGEVNLARGCEGTATFDRQAAKLAAFILVAR